MVGIPSGRISSEPALGIHTRRTGFAFLSMVKLLAISNRCLGVSDLIPSTPAVFLP